MISGAAYQFDYDQERIEENILGLYTDGDWFFNHASFVSQKPSTTIIRAYIFMASITVAILIWSVLMGGRIGLMKWFGYYGLLVVLFGTVALFSRSNMTSVSLFGAFVFGMASWLVLTGVLLIKTNQPEK